MNMECLFIFIKCIFKYLSTMSYSFQCKHFSLSIYYFWCYYNRSFLNFISRLFIASAKKYSLFFFFWKIALVSCNLAELGWSHLRARTRMCVYSLRFSHLQIYKIFSFANKDSSTSSFSTWCLLFLFLAQLLCLEPAV